MYLNLGEALEKQGENDRAIAPYEKALTLEPENRGIQRLLAEVVACEEASEVARAGLAQQLQQEEKFEEALIEYRAVLAIDENNLAALYQVAKICEGQGKWDEVVEAYRKVIEVDAEPPFWVYRHLGFALSQQANLDEATQAYEKAVELNPEDEEAQSLLEQVKAQKPDPNRFELGDILQKPQRTSLKNHDRMQTLTERLQDCYLFDRDYYLSQCDRDLGSTTPLEHFLTVGVDKDLSPHPLFDLKYYRFQLKELKKNAELLDFNHDNLLEFYLDRGWTLNANPHPLFDLDFYRQKIKNRDIDPLYHYLVLAGFKQFSPHPAFDLEYYCKQVPEFNSEQQPAILHFLYTQGKRLAPNPAFSPGFYLNKNEDIRKHNLCPSIHFFTHEYREYYRQISPIFSTEYIYNLFPEYPF